MYGVIMKVYLDDSRTTPPGWIRVFWPEEAISLLSTGKVTHLSLDHDLGDDAHGTGYDVLCWIEQQVVLHDFKPPAVMIVHSDNASARQKMLSAIKWIRNAENNQV